MNSTLLSRLLRPIPVMLIMLALSAGAWLIPGESPALRGFGERAHSTWLGLLILVAFYALALGAAYIGQLIGGKLPGPSWLDGEIAGRSRAGEFDTRLYFVLTALAIVGVGYLLFAAGGPVAFIVAMSKSEANVLKEATGGQPGLATLRYTAALAAPIGLHRALSARRGYILAGLNLALLLVSAIVASRLSLMMATVIFLFLIAHRPIAVRAKALVVGIGVGFLVLALIFLNYVRNAGFYATNGVHDPFSAAVFQALTYVGSPFQVAIGVASALGADPALFASSTFSPISVLVPSIFTNIPPNLPIGSERYHNVVDIHITLSTNSAFADTLIDYAVPGLLLSMLWLILYGVLFGFAARFNTYILASAGAALYGFAEFWRLLLMNQGVAIYAVAVPFVAGVIALSSFKIRWLDRLIPHEAASVREVQGS